MVNGYTFKYFNWKYFYFDFYFIYNSGQADLARLLIERGADIDAKDNDECTPLYVACESGTD